MIKKKSISRCYIKILEKVKSGAGFTLIELLVVILIIFSVGVLISSVLFSALRGANKTNTIDLVRRNGNSAITQMSRMIRYAQSFDGVSTDGTTYIPDCVVSTLPPLTPTPTPIEYSYVKITSFDGGVTIFSCSPPSPTPPPVIASNGASLVDDNSVSVSSCYFTCSQNNKFSPPNIGIKFSLTQEGNPQSYENMVPPVSFQTSVSVRNY